jgi:hypothetical protein
MCPYRAMQLSWTRTSEMALPTWRPSRGMFLWNPAVSRQGACPMFLGGNGHDGAHGNAYELPLV